MRLQCELDLNKNANARDSLRNLIEVKDLKDSHYNSLIDSASSYLKSVN